VQVWYGSEELPPQKGNIIDILAVVTTAGKVGGCFNVNDPKELAPEAQSDIITVSIGAIQ
jgi:hypothetical protein